MRWTSRQDSEEFDIPAPVGIEAILEYSMADPDAQVPTGVTIAGREDISSRRIPGLEIREPGEPWAAL